MLGLKLAKINRKSPDRFNLVSLSILLTLAIKKQLTH